MEGAPTASRTAAFEDALAQHYPGLVRRLTYDSIHDRFVIVGRHADGRAVAWVGQPGAWSEVPLDPGYTATEVVMHGSILVAAGVGPDGPVIVWSSYDGFTWQIHEVSPTGFEAGLLLAVSPEGAMLALETFGLGVPYAFWVGAFE